MSLPVHRWKGSLLFRVLGTLWFAGMTDSQGERTLPTKLTVCFVWADDSYYSAAQRLVAAVDLAVQHANHFVLDKPLSLDYVYLNSGPSCSRRQYSVVSSVFPVLTHEKCHVFVGAGCPFVALILYGFAHLLQVPLLGIPAAGFWSVQAESAIEDFNLMILAAYGYSDLTALVTGFLEKNGYFHATLFRDDSYPYFMTWTETFLKFVRNRNPTLFRNTFLSVVRSKIFDHSMFKDLLRSAHERSRVMLIFGHADCVRQILLAAHELGMTNGQYVYLAVELFPLEFWGTIDPTIGASSDPIAIQAYQSLIVVAFLDDPNPGPYLPLFDATVKLLAKQKFNYTFEKSDTVDVILMSHYEAILMYAEVVNQLKTLGLNYTDGRLITNQMINSSFHSPLQKDGDEFRIGADRQRTREYCMKIYNPAADEMQVLMKHQPQLNQSFHYTKQLPWPSGYLPPDEPRCGFRGDKCLSPEAIAVISVVVIIVLITVVSGGIFIYLKVWKLRADYDPDRWRIPVEDLQVKDVRTGSKRTLASKSTGGTGFSSIVVDLFATYRGRKVALVDVSDRRLIPSNQLIDQLNTIKPIKHPNLQAVFGIALSASNICLYIVGEFCTKGCLGDVLDNELFKLDWFFKNSLIRDIVSGMAQLHSTPVISHGALTSYACLIDARFTLQICDYGITFFRDPGDLPPPRVNDDRRDWSILLWRAPELLRQTMPAKGTQKGDVYSFAVLLQQIILRSGPFELPDDPLELSDKEIVQEVIAANIPPVRPRVPRSSCSTELYELMERCWQETPVERPTFPKIKERIERIMGRGGENLVDLLLHRMEQYAGDLEEKVAEQTRQFTEEKSRSEQLLSQLLPKTIASALTRGLSIPPEAFDCVTIFFSDVVGFTVIAGRLKPIKVVDLLNGLYTLFDRILEGFDVYKVETTGDNYLVASGLPVRNGNRHVVEISLMALQLMKEISSFSVPEDNGHVRIRAGINSGSCVAGIVGTKMPRYCLFGDTVNVASRMESTGEPMKIQISSTTKDLLDREGGFLVAERGEVRVKGKGSMMTYWLLGESST